MYNDTHNGIGGDLSGGMGGENVKTLAFRRRRACLYSTGRGQRHIQERNMKKYWKLSIPVAFLLGIASSGAIAWDGCWFCEQQYRQCVRNGGDIEQCWIDREECYAMNGCMAQ